MSGRSGSLFVKNRSLHDIAEITLKLAANTNQSINQSKSISVPLTNLLSIN